MEHIDSVTEFSPVRSASAATMLGAAIGDEVAQRVLQGAGTLCDVVLAAWALDVDPVDAVLQYADAAGGTAFLGATDERCA